MIPVWTFVFHYPVLRRRLVDRVRLDLGAGFNKSAIKSQAFTRADGTGGVTSYAGANIFEIPVLRRRYDGDTLFLDILDFLQLRVDNGDEAFYFYYPDELATPDPTGANTTGRYLVKHLDPIEDVLTHLSVHDFTRLIFHEQLV